MENTLKPENQRILVCYQIGGEEPIRLWRFEENSNYNPIIEGDLNLDAFLFSFYEHGSLSDDLLDNSIYITHEDVYQKPKFGPVLAVTCRELYDLGYVERGSLEGFIDNVIKYPSYFKDVKMEELNELVTDALLASGINTIAKSPLPTNEMIERSVKLCHAFVHNDFNIENYTPVFNEGRTSVTRYAIKETL